MGGFQQISSISGVLKSRSKAMVPLCDRLIRLAEDSEFDGIWKMVVKLEK